MDEGDDAGDADLWEEDGGKSMRRRCGLLHPR